MRDTELKPLIKWVGGKRQLAPALMELAPKRFALYCEPFLGGAAMLLSMRPKAAVVNDLNADLINLYTIVRDRPEDLISDLGRHENTAEYYYAIRALDRSQELYATLDELQRASRFLYLNRTCFNGLFRVNAEGHFNVPFGRYKDPKLIDAENIMNVSRYLRSAKISFCSADFAEVLSRVPSGGFVYLDPPYDPLSKTADFTAYNKDGFGRDEQLRLKECCDELTRRKVKFMMSNSATEFIQDLYKDYDTRKVRARRGVSAKAKGRQSVDEVVIRNYRLRNEGGSRAIGKEGAKKS